MRRTSFANWPCSIARTIDLIGDPWTPLVLREAFYGIRRFDDLQAALGIPRNTLADRLKRLTDEQILQKQAYDTRPVRHEYLLTDKGRDFFTVLAAMNAWGDRWLTDTDGPPVVFHHTTCGHDSHAEVICAECREPLDADHVTPRPGPGYPQRLLTRPDIRRRFHLDD